MEITEVKRNLEKLISHITKLINEKKELQDELATIKTELAKAKNQEKQQKNSEKLLNYIEKLDDYILQINNALISDPEAKEKLLRDIQEKLNRNFQKLNKIGNTSQTPERQNKNTSKPPSQALAPAEPSPQPPQPPPPQPKTVEELMGIPKHIANNVKKNINRAVDIEVIVNNKKAPNVRLNNSPRSLNNFLIKNNKKENTGDIIEYQERMRNNK